MNGHNWSKETGKMEEREINAADQQHFYICENPSRLGEKTEWRAFG